MRGAREEMRHVIEDLHADGVGEDGFKRMTDAILRREKARLGNDSLDSSEYEISPKNGLPIRRSELEKLSDLVSRPQSGN